MCLELLSLVIALSCLFKEALVSSHLLHKKKGGGGANGEYSTKNKIGDRNRFKEAFIKKKEIKSSSLTEGERYILKRR